MVDQTMYDIVLWMGHAPHCTTAPPDPIPFASEGQPTYR